MTKPAVLITAIESDRAIAEELLQELQKSGVSCRLLPADESAEDLHDIVAQIENTITSFGVMLIVLSRKSAYNHRIISNVQYACEQAKRRATLVIYQIEEVPSENPLALYYSQSILINAAKKKQAGFQKVINNVKRILGHPQSSSAFRPRRLSPKATKRLVIGGVIIALLVGAGIALWSRFIVNAEEPQPAISTPVVFEDPYSEQSLDQDIIIDTRSAPEYETYGDPALDAPFHFQPEFIHKTISFDDPTYDGLVNYGEIEHFSVNITSYDKIFFQQTDDVLQISLAPHENALLNYNFPIKHAFASDETNYLGFRFRYTPYLGWLNAEDEINLFFEAVSNGPKDHALLAKLNIVQQDIELPDSFGGSFFPCDEEWHTLEFLHDDASDSYDVYLDGALIGKTDPMTVAQYWILILVLDHPSSTDWINLYLDEIIFGGDQPLLKADDPGDVDYAFTPDEVMDHYGFDVFLPDELIEGREYARVEDGVMKFSAEGTRDVHIMFEFPVSPITETNYASMKYRFDDDLHEYWSDWGGASIIIGDASPSEENEPGISIEAHRYHPEYSLSDGNTIEGVLGSEENLNLGGWHTMEMIVEPLSVENDQYLLKFWHDGVFVAEIEINSVENLLDPENRLVCRFNFYSDADRQGAFSGEIAELTIGYIAFPDLIEE